MRIADFRVGLLILAPLGCLLPGAASAQCTKPLTLKNEVQMTSRGIGSSSVPIQINNTQQSFTFATAGTTTQISMDLAKSLKLDVKHGDTVLYDDSGNAYREEVTLSQFTLGNLHGTNLTLPISPGGGRGGGRGGGGIFSLNFMLPYDVDVDFGTDKLRFFDQDHCPGAVLYWKTDSVVGTAPITIDKGRITIPVLLEGKALTGVIDTASFDTSIHAAVADRVVGLKLGDAANVADDPSKSSTGQTYRHPGATITIGALTLSNVALNIQADIATLGGGGALEMANRRRGIESEMAQPEVRIGMDVLRKLHLYMAFGEKKLYVTTTTSALPAAGAPPARAP